MKHFRTAGFQKVAALWMMLAVLAAAVFSGREAACAKSQDLWTIMLQETNDSYQDNLKLGLPVSSKVKLKKNTIVIYGSVRESGSGENSAAVKHTYKLAENVKFVSEGGTGPAQEMTKKEFKKYLKKVQDSGLGLIIQLKNKKAVRVSVSS